MKLQKWNRFVIIYKLLLRRNAAWGDEFLTWFKYTFKVFLKIWFNNLDEIFMLLWYDLHATLREKCPDTEFFLVRIFLYSDQENSVLGHFSRCVKVIIGIGLLF